MRKLINPILDYINKRDDLRLIGKSTIENKIELPQFHLL